MKGFVLTPVLLRRPSARGQTTVGWGAWMESGPCEWFLICVKLTSRIKFLLSDMCLIAETGGVDARNDLHGHEKIYAATSRQLLKPWRAARLAAYPVTAQ